jgi:hypothetical protein
LESLIVMRHDSKEDALMDAYIQERTQRDGFAAYGDRSRGAIVSIDTKS